MSSVPATIGSVPLPMRSSQSANFWSTARSPVALRTRMFSDSRKWRKCSHAADWCIAAATVCAREARFTIGRVWRKSPPSTTTLPPKGFSAASGSMGRIRSRSVRSSESR